MNSYDFLVLAVLIGLGLYVVINFRKILITERAEKDSLVEKTPEPELLLDNSGSIEQIEKVKEVKAKSVVSKKETKKSTKKAAKKRTRRREL